MNDTYSAYLQSEAWGQKREHRLALSSCRCDACGEEKQLEVHHLTYARIFREEMEDLMTLCRVHHAAAEEMIAKRVLSRVGDPRVLKAETLRFIRPREKAVPSPPAVPAVRPVYNGFTTHTLNTGKKSSPEDIRRLLMEYRPFLEILRLPRQKFKKAAREVFQDIKKRSRVMSNAYVIYDRRKV